MAFHRPGQPPISLSAGGVNESRAHEKPEQHSQHHDHQWAADELRRSELPAHQQSQDDAQLHHQIGRTDLEGHGRGEVGALAEQRPGQGHRRIRARRGRCAQSRRDSQGARPIVTQQSHDGRSTHDGLHHCRQRETQNQRPQDLPRHRPRQRQRMPDRSHRFGYHQTLQFGRPPALAPSNIPPGGIAPTGTSSVARPSMIAANLPEPT